MTIINKYILILVKKIQLTLKLMGVNPFCIQDKFNWYLTEVSMEIVKTLSLLDLLKKFN